MGRFAGLGVSDPLDVLAYATGALLASFAWALSYRLQATPTVRFFFAIVSRIYSPRPGNGN